MSTSKRGGVTKAALVCHDAGAANLVIAWVKAWDLSVTPVMQGPAAQLWQAAFPGTPLCASLEQALDGSVGLISGTGWASRLEHDARVLARSFGLHSVAVLDHWVNYLPRFERDGQVQWPDELWVADEWAQRIAQETLPAIPIRQFENLYLKGQVARVRPAPDHGTVLYVLEPVRQTWGCDIEGEFQALDYALEHLDGLIPRGVTRILLRPHPCELPGKYAGYLKRDQRIQMDTSPDMAHALSIADVVVGVESFALTIALAAGRPVYSSLPPWGPPSRLPHIGIRQIRNLSKL